MHPIERLRAVARAREVDQALLAREAAGVLGSFAGDLPGLVTSCRRLLDRHPTAGALWWTCSRLLAAGDVRAEARAIGHDLRDEPATIALSLDLPGEAVVAVLPDPAGGSELAGELNAWRDDLVVAHGPGALRAPRDEPRVLLVEAGAAGPDGFVAAEGTADEIAAARDAGVAVWLVVDVGRRLPRVLFEALVARAQAPGAAPGAAAPPIEIVPTTVAERVVEPRRVDCPVAPELLRARGGW
ncbi:MAG TPA: hypothetical protein VFZ79_14305 [Acidimicrobiales bacterium]